MALPGSCSRVCHFLQQFPRHIYSSQVSHFKLTFFSIPIRAQMRQSDRFLLPERYSGTCNISLRNLSSSCTVAIFTCGKNWRCFVTSNSASCSRKSRCVIRGILRRLKDSRNMMNALSTLAFSSLLNIFIYHFTHRFLSKRYIESF